MKLQDAQEKAPLGLGVGRGLGDANAAHPGFGTGSHSMPVPDKGQIKGSHGRARLNGGLMYGVLAAVNGFHCELPLSAQLHHKVVTRSRDDCGQA
jgi:hypothetical protein